MKQINSNYEAGRQIVVFDEIVTTLPGGAHVERGGAIARFTDGILPAGTAIVKDDADLYQVLAVDATAFDDVVGLTSHDVAIDDFPLVAVVTGGTFRVDAVPAFEKTHVVDIKKAVPTLISH